jgi:hypothetical protein
MEKRRTSRTTIQTQKRRRAMADGLHQNKAWQMEMAILKFPGGYFWGYTK